MTDFTQIISSLLESLRKGGDVTIKEWPLDAPFSPAEMGLLEEAGKLFLPAAVEFIETESIEKQIPDLRCQKFEIVGSTNSVMLEAASHTDIHDCLYLAEFQYGGRGRRGRHWYSPYARNLAVSYGIETKLSQNSIGCMSLVVGLSIADELSLIGLEGVEIKWPNDILIGNKKLAGILVELVDKGSSLAIVIGFGLNIEIMPSEKIKIDQPITDIKSLGISVSRNTLVSRLVKSLRLYTSQYIRDGFGSLKEIYENKLAFKGQLCELMSSQGTLVDEGILLGINSRGEIKIQKGASIQSYNSGEVSLKRATVWSDTPL